MPQNPANLKESKFTEVSHRIYDELRKAVTPKVMDPAHTGLWIVRITQFLIDHGHVARAGLVYIKGLVELPAKLLPTYNNFR
jgi:hypothetical protein